MRRRLSLFCTFLLAGVITIISCSDHSALVSDHPPPLPPENSMAMDLSAFDSQDKAKYEAASETNHFSEAAVRAFALKVIADINLAIPRALLSAAAQSDAQFTDGEQWEWAYNESVGDEEYGVRLAASGDGGEGVDWNVNITNSPLDLNDHLFFSGHSNAEGTEGTWIYYDLQNPDSEEQVSRVEWTVNGEEDTSLRLEILSGRNDNMGDYIEYAFDGTLKTAVYYDASEETEAELQWNVTTKAGYIQAPNYNDGERACWDENLQNISCSE